MWEQWALEIVYAFGRMFYNLLVYWAILLLLITGARRVKRERTNFGVKIYHRFSEITQTWHFSLLFGLLLSIISLLFGFVFSYEILIVIALVTIILSINGSLHLLSAAYTLGITFIVFMLLPLLPIDFIQLNFIERLANIQFVTIAFLVGFFLIVETLLIYFSKKHHTYPSLVLSERGVWLGEQQLKRMAIIPFFALIPASESILTLPFLPYFQLGDTTYHLTVIPFIVGTQLISRTEYMDAYKKQLAKQKLVLSIIVLSLAVSSYFYFILAWGAIVVAIAGNEWLTYRNRMRNQYSKPLFSPLDEGVKVLDTIPGSRAEELEILPGETILKVNGSIVSDSHEFYKQLQRSGAFFKLDVIDINNEIRFIQSAFYAEDHHGLGILFPEEPYQERQKERVNQLKTL